MNISLSSLIPNSGDLLQLDPGQLAHTLIRVLLSMPSGDLNLHNLQLSDTFTQGYPPKDHESIKLAVSGVWEWLRGQGFLAQRPGNADPNWVVITPQGRRWANEVFATFERDPASFGPAVGTPRICPSAQLRAATRALCPVASLPVLANQWSRWTILCCPSTWRRLAMRQQQTTSLDLGPMCGRCEIPVEQSHHRSAGALDRRRMGQWQDVVYETARRTVGCAARPTVG